MIYECINYCFLHHVSDDFIYYFHFNLIFSHIIVCAFFCFVFKCCSHGVLQYRERPSFYLIHKKPTQYILFFNASQLFDSLMKNKSFYENHFCGFIYIIFIIYYVYLFTYIIFTFCGFTPYKVILGLLIVNIYSFIS